jgi:hypothetical protein
MSTGIRSGRRTGSGTTPRCEGPGARAECPLGRHAGHHRARQPGGRSEGCGPARTRGMLGTPLPPDGDPDARMRFSEGQGYAEGGLVSEHGQRRQFTEACLHGLRARLCDDVDGLDNCPLPVAALARKVAVLQATPAREPVLELGGRSRHTRFCPGVRGTGEDY